MTAPEHAAAGPVESEILAALPDSAVTAAGDGRPLRTLRGGPGSAGAETVVLLHGRGHAAAIWFPCWPALAAAHRLLAVDLPGFGGSPAESPTGGAEGALRLFADPVEALLQAEVAVTGAAGLSLVGHSLGGLVALELALRGRLPIRRLVLIDAMGLGPALTLASRLFFRARPERLARLLGPRGFERLNPSPPTPLGRRVASLEYELLTAARAARRAAARAFDRLCPLVGPAFNRAAQLPGLDCPALLLWGERDAAVPVANAVAAAAVLPRAELLRFPLGHSPHLEAPELVLPPLLRFLLPNAG